MKQYVVDAFTDQVFAGNPAAVIVSEAFPSEELMQKIAIENNLSETAFAVKEGDIYHLRWFTPGGEVELCGHATLATAYVILRFVEPELTKVSFTSLGGMLHVEKDGDLLCLNFPAFHLQSLPVTEEMCRAIGVTPVAAYQDADLVLELESADAVRSVVPDQEIIRSLHGVCLHITAKDSEYDCVTRTFAPKCNIPEDPVCGRGHCHVIPLWAEKLKKTEFTAYQASPRGGVLYCSFQGERVILRGKAALYSEAELFV